MVAAGRGAVNKVTSESCKPADIVAITEAIADLYFTGKCKLVPVCPVKGNGATNIILVYILYLNCNELF